MIEYTPTTEEIRYRLIPGADTEDLNEPEREELEEFDRWLNEIRAEVWDECVNQMPLDLDWKNQYSDLNPYRHA